MTATDQTRPAPCPQCDAADLPPDELHIDIKQVAHRLGMSTWAVRDLVRYGRLPAFKVGTGHNAAVRVKVSDVQALLVPVVPKPRPHRDFGDRLDGRREDTAEAGT